MYPIPDNNSFCTISVTQLCITDGTGMILLANHGFPLDKGLRGVGFCAKSHGANATNAGYHWNSRLRKGPSSEFPLKKGG